MSDDNTPKRKVNVDKIASANPRINAAKFKEWRQKMDRIERLGLSSDERHNPPPRQVQSFPIGSQRVRSGNLSR